jgi:hypothetical protein
MERSEIRVLSPPLVPHFASAFALRASADSLARNPPELPKRAKARSLHAGYELNRFSERPVAEENKTLACPDKMRQPGIPT